jgi:hypothetical protein
MRKPKRVVTREQIRDALETTYREYFGEFGDNAFANAVQGFLDGEVDPVEIAETIIGVVHQLAEKGRHDLAWHWEALLADTEERTYSGSFSFVLVDARTAKCLTFRRITGLYPIVDYTFRVRTVEDVVSAVAYLLSLLGVRVEFDQQESGGEGR